MYHVKFEQISAERPRLIHAVLSALATADMRRLYPVLQAVTVQGSQHAALEADLVLVSQAHAH